MLRSWNKLSKVLDCISFSHWQNERMLLLLRSKLYVTLLQSPILGNSSLWIDAVASNIDCCSFFTPGSSYQLFGQWRKGSRDTHKPVSIKMSPQQWNSPTVSLQFVWGLLLQIWETRSYFSATNRVWAWYILAHKNKQVDVWFPMRTCWNNGPQLMEIPQLDCCDAWPGGLLERSLSCHQRWG